MTFLIFGVLFIGFSTTFQLLFCEITGAMSQVNVVLSLVLGAVTAGFATKKSKDVLSLKFSKPEIFDWVMIAAFFLFCYRFFLWIAFPKDGGVWTLDTNVFGDLPGHIGYINNLANETKFWPESPIIVGDPFGYPFGIDLFSAMFVKLGVPLTNSLPLMGFACGLLLLAALYLWGRGFALGSFLFSGGMAGFAIFQTKIWRDYDNDMAWKSLPLALLLPQRGFLYAFPAGLLLLWSWKRRFIDGEKGLPIFVEGLIWGLMPLFHIHTFIFLSVIFVVWGVASRKISEGLKIFAWAVVPATYEMIRLTDGFRRASVMSFKPGWMIDTKGVLPFLSFFWMNYGVYVPLTMAAIYFAVKFKDRKSMLLILPAAVIYFICLFVMFAPWEWDNTKIMVWSYLLCLPVIFGLVIARVPRILRVPLYGCLFFSGFVSVYSLYQAENRGFSMYQRDEIESVCKVLEKIDHRFRIATAQVHNHPVSLCGYRIVAGYAGTLWSQGQTPRINQVQDNLRKLMTGDTEWQKLAKDLSARYIFWGPNEMRDYSASTRPWEKSSVKIAEGPWGALYDLGE